MSTKLERLFHMDALIRNGSYPSVKTFMERFEVSERTVLNDIRFFKGRLRAINHRLSTSACDGKDYRLGRFLAEEPSSEDASGRPNHSKATQ